MLRSHEPTVVVPVTDLRRAMDFYTRVLQLPVEAARLTEGEAEIRLGRDLILLKAVSKPAGRVLRIKHLAFEVESLANAQKALAKHGVHVETGARYCLDERRQGLIKDPDGHQIILIDSSA